VKLSIKSFLPLLIGSGIALIVYSAVGWWGFLFLGFWVGGWITVGALLASRQKGLKRDLGRRVSILVIGLTLMIFLGVIEHENLQVEENIFYLVYFLSGGAFTRVLIHYSVAKVFGPLLFRRGFCGWACRCSPPLYSFLSFSFGRATITGRFTLIKPMGSGDNFAGLS
jgi:ferredoxin-type protein NapH